MVRTSRILLGILVLGAGLCAAGSARAATGFGSVAGVVLDGNSIPQMGASVALIDELSGVSLHTQLFTNQKGTFADARVPVGLYEVRVTLAGFLPSIQRNVRVISNLSTLVKVELTTVFASLDRLRHAPAATSTSADDWKWIVRTSAATRPILQMVDPSVAIIGNTPDVSQNHPTRAEVELTSGSPNPGSISNLPDAPASAFAYDQSVGSMGRLLLAAQMSYGRDLYVPAVAAIWTPLGGSAISSLTVRQTSLGPSGLNFIGARLAQKNSMSFGDHVTLHYGGEVLVASLGRTTESLRPSADLDIRFSPEWTAHLLLASEPDSEAPPSTAALDAAIAGLDAFPVLLVRNDRPVLAGGWHEEFGISRKLGDRTTIETAVYHDRSSDTPVFGRGNVSNPDFLEDPTSNAFAYDAGSFDSWGTRVALRQKLTNDLDLAMVYAYAGAMVPGDLDLQGEVRDALQTRYRHSLALRMSGKIQRSKTQFAASYKWIDGGALTRQDAYGEAAYDLDPYLSVSFRQDLPGSLWNSRWQVVAEVRNLLAQGYAIIPSQDGAILLTPACRTIRGGLSFQF
jgi:hypothetical protein